MYAQFPFVGRILNLKKFGVGHETNKLQFFFSYRGVIWYNLDTEAWFLYFQNFLLYHYRQMNQVKFFSTVFDTDL